MTKKTHLTKAQPINVNDPLPPELLEWEIVNNNIVSGKVSNSLYREFLFSNFEQAFEFMTKASLGPIKLQNHHPRWLNNYNKVEVWLSTNDSGGVVTSRDFVLAQSLSNLFLELV